MEIKFLHSEELQCYISYVYVRARIPTYIHRRIDIDRWMLHLQKVASKQES